MKRTQTEEKKQDNMRLLFKSRTWKEGASSLSKKIFDLVLDRSFTKPPQEYCSFGGKNEKMKGAPPLANISTGVPGSIGVAPPLPLRPTTVIESKIEARVDLISRDFADPLSSLLDNPAPQGVPCLNVNGLFYY